MVEITPDHRELITSPKVDAVAIATPVSTHFDLAMSALQAGKHVFVEKPLTATADQARRLIDEADTAGLTLMVDHTFVYTGAVRKIQELVDERRAWASIYYYDSVRVNLGLFQHDVNVHLGPGRPRPVDHGLRARPRAPVAVSATGMGHVAGEPGERRLPHPLLRGQP